MNRIDRSPARRARPACRCRVLFAVLVAPVLAGCQLLPLLHRSQPPDQPAAAGHPPTQGENPLAQNPPGNPQSISQRDGSPAGGAGHPGMPHPGPGVVTGRLVDAVTGLPVVDAGVSLLGLEQRTISGPDGRFRFDGVAGGSITLVFGPADGYVPASVVGQLESDGLDIGLHPLLPMTYSALITPEYGGRIAACGVTKVDFVTGALADPEPVWVTCIEKPEEFPAPPPAGRLPLAVVDLAPGELVPTYPLRVTVSLPPQPRYAAGVQIDLLRLDLERLIWTPTTVLSVDPGGKSASGELAAFGTYMAAAPPFGAFQPGTANGPAINGLSLADKPGALEPADTFGADRDVVYLVFDYANMNNTPILVRTVDKAGAVLFEAHRPYTDQGHEQFPMVTASGVHWPVGNYVTTLYFGDPFSPFDSLEWRVVAAPTPTAPPPTPPPAPPRSDVEAFLPPGGASSAPGVAGGAAGTGYQGGSSRGGSSSGGLSTGRSSTGGGGADYGCIPPVKWWPRVVLAGDTLSDLAWRTGTSLANLSAANCLKSSVIQVGQVIYVPRPPLDTKLRPYPSQPRFPDNPWYPTRAPRGYATYAPNPYSTPDPYATRRPPYGYPTLPVGPWTPGPGGPAETKTPKFATLPIPTTWYTPPVPEPGPGRRAIPPTAPPFHLLPATQAAPQPPPQPPAQPTAHPPAQQPIQPILPPKETRPPDPTLAPRP